MELHKLENRGQGGFTAFGGVWKKGEAWHYSIRKQTKEECCKNRSVMGGKRIPPVGHFHYHQGVFLSGVYQTWLECGDEKYFEYMKAWVDACIDEKGEIHEYDKGQLDDIQPGILLFPLYERTKDEQSFIQ